MHVVRVAKVFLNEAAHRAVHIAVDVLKDFLVVQGGGGQWSWRMIASRMILHAQPEVVEGIRIRLNGDLANCLGVAVCDGKGARPFSENVQYRKLSSRP
jgi:hypothetical protein